MIKDTLKDKTSKEKSQIKSFEIAKIKNVNKLKVTNTYFDGDIEVKDIKTVEINGQDGIEYFARAWDKQGNSIGFGEDGSVEWERFRVFNPRILVDDPNGDIIQEWIDEDTGETKTRILREDLVGALIKDLVHTISIVGKNGNQIVKGKIGNTTSTFYPDANPESTSVDGRVRHIDTAGLSWAAITSAAGNASDANSAISRAYAIRADGNTDEWDLIDRGIFLFDTSAIDDGDTVTSATFSLVPSTVINEGSVAGLNVYSSNPASDTNVVNGDFDSLGSTEFSTTVNSSDLTTEVYEDFILNASGIAAIDETGITKLGTREANYDATAIAPTWSSGLDEIVNVYNADETGTDKDPKLVVVHSLIIAVDATSEGQTTGTSLTVSHTTTGTNPALFVYVLTNLNSDPTEYITGVTYNGVAMTQLRKQDFTTSDNSWHYIYGLLDPATGTNDIVISTDTSVILLARAVSYVGVDTDQTLPDASNSDTGTSVGSLSTSITTIADNCWIFAGGYGNQTGGVDAGTNLTLRVTGTDTSYSAFDTNSSITPAGATTIEITQGSLGKMMIIGVSFAPVTSAPVFDAVTPTPTLLTLNVG